MAVAVRAGSRVLVEALEGSASPTDVLRAVRRRARSCSRTAPDGLVVPRAAPPRGARAARAPGAFAAARALLDRASGEAPAGAPPFWGGIAGSFGYDLARGLEQLPSLARDDLGLPAAAPASDRRAARVRPPARRRARDRAERRGIRRLPRSTPRPTQSRPRRQPAAQLEGMSYARTGRSPSACSSTSRAATSTRPTSRTACRPPAARPVELYAALRESAPVPYNLYLDGERLPARRREPRDFLRMRPDGSSRRGRSRGPRRARTIRREDRALAAALAASAKDRAENTMIVDLARNDLSRVCPPGTVRVSELCAVESHPTVHQMVSTVEAAAARHRRARRGRGGVPARLDDRLPEGAGDAGDRAARARAARALCRRLRLDRPDGACDLAVVIRTAVVTAGGPTCTSAARSWPTPSPAPSTRRACSRRAPSRGARCESARDGRAAR